HDFGNVRIHSDSRAAAAAHALAAQAYTAGRHIVFGAGQYAPDTTAGRRLLAHELVHVVQQGQAGRARRPDGPPVTGAAGAVIQRQATAEGGEALAPASPEAGREAEGMLPKAPAVDPQTAQRVGYAAAVVRSMPALT